jgi:hypothetical protein
VTLLKLDPVWEPLKNNPEYSALINKYRKTYNQTGPD